MTKLKVLSKDRKLIVILALCIAAILAIGVTLTKIIGTAEDVSYRYAYEIDAEYEKNEVVTFPECTMVVGSEKITTEIKIYYPDGRISHKYENNLDALGEYTVEYSAAYKGDNYVETKTFVVKNGYRSLFSNGNGITVEGYAPVPSEIADDDYIGNRSGVVLKTTKENAVTQYNGVIDLSETAGDLPFITLQVTPSEIGKKDIARLWITLTDIYDENNFITVLAQSGDSGNNWELAYPDVTYISTAACGRYNPIGWIRFHDQTGPNGMTAAHTFLGQVEGSWYGSHALSLYFNPKTLSLLTRGIGGQLDTILKYDDANVLSSQEVWGGFTTNEVYLSIKTERLMADEGATFMVTSIGGKDIDDNYFAENQTEIYIDCGEFSEDNLPNGVKGLHYPVFDAFAYDYVLGLLNPTKVSVYNTVGQEIAIENGYFKTNETGKYQIVYTFESLGGYVEKVLEVTVGETYQNALGYTVNTDIPSTAAIGDTIIVYDGVAEGGVGTLSVETKLLVNGEETALMKGAFREQFLVETVGTYTLQFTVTDRIGGTYITEKEIVVDYPNAPIIIEPSLPSSVVKGHSITFPIAQANYYTAAGSETVDVKLFINGEDYTNKAYTATENFTLKYVATLKNGVSSEWSKAISVVDVAGEETLNVSAYFVSSDVDGNGVKDVQTSYREGDTDYIYLSTQTDHSYFEFIKKLYADSLEIVFDVDESANNFQAVNVYLTDSVDARNSIKLTVRNEMFGGVNSSVLYVNDEYSCILDGSFLASRTPFSFVINNYDKVLKDSNGKQLATLTRTRYGYAFDGFESGELYARFEFVNVTGESALKISTIGNQSFSSLITRDNAKPVVVFDEPFATTLLVGYGEKVEFPNAKIYDVLSEVTKFTLTITSADGKKLYEGDVPNDFSITFDNYGRYTAKYEGYDSAKQKVTLNKFIEVIDREAPTLTVTEGYKQVYAVGNSLEKANYTATDNVDTEVSVYYGVIDATGCCRYITGDYKFEAVGKYTIVIYACDSSDNFTCYTYDIVVQ